MKAVYFNIDNGAVVDPSEYMPAYCAVVKGMKVLELKACFAIDNIERNGDLWALQEVLKSQMEWSNYAWLLKSLKRYLAINYFREQGRDFQAELSPRFEYVAFWPPGHRPTT